MSTSSGRAFVLGVIEKYRKQPCLWQVCHEDYHNKLKRNRAIDDILELFKERDPSANRETVLKKLSSIRGAFNKELRKVKASLTKGSDPHVPKLWYFNYLNFLKDKEAPRNSQTDLSALDDMPFGDEEIDDSFADSNSEHSSSCTSSVSPHLKRPAQRDDQVPEPVVKRERVEPPPTVPARPIDKKKAHDIFGQYVAEKLHSLPAAMVPYCQKIINDAIFLSEMQSLNMTSRIVTDPTASNQNRQVMAYYTALDPLSEEDEP